MRKLIAPSLIACLLGPLVLVAHGPMALAQAPAEKQFNQCKKVPSGKRILKLELKPDAEIADLVSWISAITCAQFILPADTAIKGKKVTVVTNQLMTLEEAHQLFEGALASVNLKVEPEGKFLRIVETKPRKP